jgi:hypothetical protein
MIKKLLLSLIILICAPIHAKAQAWSGIIDPTRATDWSGVGASIASRSTICATLSAGVTASAMNAAIAACPANQVVFLNAGTYSIGGFHVNKNNVTLRGAGPNSTILNFTSSGDSCNGLGADICIPPSSNAFFVGSAQVQPGGSNACTWTGGFAQGATSLTVTNCGSAGLLNGQTIIIDQANDNCGVDTGGVLIADTGTCGDGNSDGRTIGGVHYSQTQVVTVTAGCASACTGAGPFTITISPGLRANNWRIGRTPGLWWTGRVSGVGIENMTVNHANLTGASGIYFYDCDSCWVQNVRSETGARNHIWVYQSSKVTVRDSYFWNTQSHASQSYGVELFISGDVLVENNISQQVASFVVCQSSQGSVVGYNFDINNYYATSTTWQQNISAQHNAGCEFTLYEGNELDGSIYSDNIHGVSGLTTQFRNRANGRGNNGGFGLTSDNTFAVALQYGSRVANIIGNVLGTAGYHLGYQTGTCNVRIYMIGYAATACGGSVDALVASTLMRWGNYDVVNAAVRWDGTESSPSAVTFVNAQSTPASHTLPNSFYLAAQPSWMTRFPAIGPDVTGGSGPGGFSYAIDAHACYNSLGGAANGTGGPLNFDAASCYTPTSPTITTASLPAGAQGVAYSVMLSATGGTLPYVWSIILGGLPTGLSLNSSTGVISGTPTVLGTNNFTVQVSDAGSLTDSKPLSITVGAPPTITTASLPQGTQGAAYSTTLSATGGTPPYSWSISVGSLPAGLSLNFSTGAISGTPALPGTTSFTVHLVDAGALVDNKSLSITIASLGAPTGILPM